MGLMSKLLGFTWTEKEEPTENYGGHQINHSAVLTPTHESVPSPDNPGNFSSVRSVPVLEDPRYFNTNEAEILKEMAKAKRQDAKSTTDAYKALKDIEESDVKVHSAHYNYKYHLADREVKKLDANANYAQGLHRLRPQYAELNLKLAGAERQADSRIEEIKSKMKQDWSL